MARAPFPEFTDESRQRKAHAATKPAAAINRIASNGKGLSVNSYM